MELVIPVAAVAVAVAALIVALGLRSAVAQTTERISAASREMDRVSAAVAACERSLGETREQLAAVRDELTGARGELEELKAAASPPPLQLPRGRIGGLDDLREELRAAAQESDEDEEA